MKVLRLIEAFYPFMSGPANQAYMISKQLKNKGIKSPILTTFYQAPKSPSKEMMDGVSVQRFKIRHKFMRYMQTPQMMETIRKMRPDIIHAHNYRSYQTDTGYRYARKHKIPFVLSAHGSITGFDTSLKGLQKLPYGVYDFFTMKRALNADAIVVNSKQELNRAIRFGINKKKLHIIPVGIDIDKYKTKRKLKDEITLLFVGNISRNRNVEPIIKSIQHIDKKIKLRIVGEEMKSSDVLKEGYIDELKTLAEKLHVSRRIQFVGAKYDDELIEEYKSADIFIYTSISENFGQTLLEAAAAGLPIISTPVGIADEIITKSTGRIVGFDDVKGIVKAVEEVHPDMGHRLQRLVEKRYSWKAIIDSYVEIYNSVLR